MSTPKDSVTELKERVLKIMLVDDEEVVLLVLVRILQSIGHCCVVFTSAKLALRAFCDGDGDASLLITDMQMPDQSGLEFLKAVRVKKPGLPVIVMSGSVLPKDRDDAMSAGANCFLAKPFGPEDLKSAVNAIFAAPAPVQ